MCTHLLTTAAALLAAMPAHAQDATWSTAPANSDFNTAANWMPATVPTGTAFFGASTITGLTFHPGAVNSLGGFTFNAWAPAYSFSLGTASTLTFTGAGIVNNSSNAPTFSLPFTSLLAFANSSTAGNASITNSGTNAVTQFLNSSTAANATITNTNSGFTAFNNSSTAGNAIITSGSGGFASFLGSSTAGNATIPGFTTFGNTTTAGNATITANLGGTTSFANSSTAGNATLIANNGGTTLFTNSSTAGNATVVTNFGGTTQFSQFSTGGNAAFTTPAGGVFDMSGVFFGMTAGSIAGGGTYFLGSNALIVGGNNLSTTVDGTISDGGASGGTGGSLVKVGPGILTLAGTNTYTGATIVNAGVLAVNGSIARSSLTTVNSGAVLFGSGTVGSTVVNAGGFLVPGNSPGTMTVAGDLTIQRNALYVVQVTPADGFEHQCERQRLAGRHRRGRLLPRHLSRAQLHNFDGRQPAHGQVRGSGDIRPAAQLQG